MKKNRVIIGSLILSALLISGCKDHKKKTNKPDNTTNTYTQEQGGTITLGTDIVITGAPSGLGASAKAADNTKLTEVDGNITQAKELTFVNLNKDTEIELTLKINEISKSILKSESGSATIGTYVIAQYINNSWKEIGYLYPSTATELKAKITLAQNTAGTMVVAVREKAEPLAITSGNPSTGFTPAGNLISEAIRTGTGVDAALYPSFNILGDKSIDFHWTDAFIGDLYKFTDNKVVIGEISGKDLEAFIVDRSKKYFNVDFQANNLEYRLVLNSDGSVKSKEILLNGSALEEDKTYTIALDAYNFSNNKYGTITGFTKKSESELTQKELLSNYIKGLKVFPQLDGKNSSVIKDIPSTDTIIVNTNGYSEYTEAGILMSEALRVEGGLDIMLYPSSSLKTGAQGNFNKDMQDTELDSFINSLYSYNTNKVVKGTISGADLKKFITERAGSNFNLDIQGGKFTYDLVLNVDKTVKTSSFKLNGVEIDDSKTYTVGIDSYQYKSYKSDNNFSNIFTEQAYLGTEKDLLRSYLKKGEESLDFTAYDSKVAKDLGDLITDKKIYDIQGESFLSPFVDKGVKVTGIVTAVYVKGVDRSGFVNGFYIQDETGDGNAKTSDGIYVKGYYNNIKVGDKVDVTGLVTENISKYSGLSETQIELSNCELLSSGNSLPKAVVLGKDRPIPQKVISSFEGNLNDKPALNLSEGIDFYESLEGMRVAIENPTVTDVKSTYGDLYVRVDNNYEVENVTNMGGLVITEGDFNPELIHIKRDPRANYTNSLFGDTDSTNFANPVVAVGDKFNGTVEGIMQYNNDCIESLGMFIGGYFFLNSKELPSYTQKNNAKEVVNLTGDSDHLTVASYNVENLYAGAGHMEAIAKSIVTNLKSPDIVGLIEIQDNDGENDGAKTGSAANKTLETLVNEINANGGPIYKYINIDPEENQDGGAPGGNIRVAYIYNPARVQFNASAEKATATTVGSVNPDGSLNMNPVRINPVNEAFENTRKSLAAQFVFNGEKITVIANHLNSKRGDTSLWGATQPVVNNSEVKRTKMATEINEFAVDLIDKGNNVVLLGDFNEFYFGTAMRAFDQSKLTNLIENKLDSNERFTYSYSGNAQTLDHILVSGKLVSDAELDIVHMNAGFTTQISDHDPVVSKFYIKNPGDWKPEQLGEILTSDISGNTSEDGDTATFTVKLGSLPTNDVTISLTSSDATEGTVAPAELVFTPENWSDSQTVTVTGVDDDIIDEDQEYKIILAPASSSDAKYNELKASDITVVNKNNDEKIVAMPTDGQLQETFDNIDKSSGNSYVDAKFTGTDGINWQYIQSRTSDSIEGNAIMLGRNRTPKAELISSTITGTLKTVRFTYKKSYSADVNLNVLINDKIIGNVKTSGETGPITAQFNFETTGDFVIKFQNEGGQVTIDNVILSSKLLSESSESGTTPEEEKKTPVI